MNTLRKNIHILILGIASAVSVSALAVLYSFDQSRLSAFGPTAKIYFFGLKNGFLASTIILLVSLVSCLFLKKQLLTVYASAKYIFRGLSDTKKGLVVLGLCLAFSFTTHAGNIMHGYFNMDDFQIAGINRTSTFGQSLLVPHGNDHTMPLFMAEMRAGDALFGQDPRPYNAVVFILFSLIPFFTYLVFKRLGIGTKSWLTFLIIFSGATSWADMLCGFNIMSTYSQIVGYFAAALWGYTAWFQTRQKRYLLFFALSTICSITIDLPGIWTLPTLFLFMVYLYAAERDGASATVKAHIKGFLVKNGSGLATLAAVCVGFGIFFYITFHIIQPDTFLSGVKTTGDKVASVENRDANWKPLPLAKNFLYFFSSGVSTSLFAPNVAKILVHPSVRDHAQRLWPIFEILVLIGNIYLFWFVTKRTPSKERKLAFFIMAGLFIIISMVVIARPNHEPIPDFDYRYAGASFYFYCLFMALSASLLLKSKGDRAIKIILPLAIVALSCQQAFSFHAARLEQEAKDRNAALSRLNNTLLSELDAMSTKNKALVIPNLAGGNIIDQVPGFSLADYRLFFDKAQNLTLVQNSAVLQTNGLLPVTSLRASTSPEFKLAFKSSSTIKSYYAAPVLMVYTPIEASAVPSKSTIPKSSFDPEKRHIVRFALATDSVPGNLEVLFSFKNDFNATSTLGRIRIDDYTKYSLVDGRRVYAIETDLLQLYSYALSNKVSEITITVPPSKNASLSGAQLL